MSAGRRESYLSILQKTESEWLPFVREMRPDSPWHTVLRTINASRPVKFWTMYRLMTAVKHYVLEGFLDPATLQPAKKRSGQNLLISIVAGIVRANREMTLREIAVQLEALRKRTPRGNRQWSISSVQKILN